MSARIREHIRSNIVGYLALFIALSGTAYAANTVGSDDVIDNSLQSVDLKDNAAVRSADVINDTTAGEGLKAIDLAPGSVGTSEVHADSLTGEDIKESTLAGVLRCPAGFGRAVDVCYDAQHAAASWDTALSTCGDAGLRLPTLAEAWLVVGDVPIKGSTGTVRTWSQAVEVDIQPAGEALFVSKYKDESGSSVGITVGSRAGAIPYRCVTSPTN